MTLYSRKLGSIESLEQRQLMAADTLEAVAADVEPSAMIFVKIPNLGDASVQTDSYGHGKRLLADSFSFEVEREMKESDEKGGTADINIGVGELQECTISKSTDCVSPLLAQLASHGNSPDTAEIDFVEVANIDQPTDPAFNDFAFAELDEAELQYKLDRCFIKSWSTSGAADDRPTI